MKFTEVLTNRYICVTTNTVKIWNHFITSQGSSVTLYRIPLTRPPRPAPQPPKLVLLSTFRVWPFLEFYSFL